MPFPFEFELDDVEANIESCVDSVFGALESEFLLMPRGDGFVDFAEFDGAYEALKRATAGFRNLTPLPVARVVLRRPICLIVLRCMLGFTPPEWAYYASRHSGFEISQGAARALDRAIRLKPNVAVPRTALAKRRRIEVLVESACHLLDSGAVETSGERFIHRLDKADTQAGLGSVVAASEIGVPYSVLLYERLLGRPFASHRDSVSELVGDVLESAIEDVLSQNRISYRKTKRAERLAGFDQVPDFVVPNEHNAQVVIEAKLSEDDGTARDKVTRIQHLAELSVAEGGTPRFEVVACIAGRGFGVRREDMKKLILATGGKVFTLQNMDNLVEHTSLSDYRSTHGA